MGNAARVAESLSAVQSLQTCENIRLFCLYVVFVFCLTVFVVSVVIFPGAQGDPDRVLPGENHALGTGLEFL